MHLLPVVNWVKCEHPGWVGGRALGVLHLDSAFTCVHVDNTATQTHSKNTEQEAQCSDEAGYIHLINIILAE